MAYSAYTPDGATTNDADDTVDLPDDSELETSGIGAINTPIEELADRIAKIAPDVQSGTGGFTWTKPSSASVVRIVAVADGGDGG